MAFFLQHYFDPDFDYLNRKPDTSIVGGQASDLFSLGFVQNVIDGQILAEMLPLDKAGPTPDTRFIQNNQTFPAGANTKIDPAYPQYLLAATNGYVFYYQGKITVKSLLNVRQDVSFRTGNIFFVGDMAVHGDVRAGFAVQANNLRLMGMLEGGIARSRRDMKVDGGAKGSAGQHCLLDAGGKLVTNFLEKIEARAKNTIVVEKYCLYSTVYAGTNMVVRDQLYGGTINAYGSVFVGRQLGNKAGIATQVYLGYDPRSIQHLEKIDKVVTELSHSIKHLKAIAGHLPPDANEASKKLASLRLQRERLVGVRNELWAKLNLDESYMDNCRLMVAGKVFPGVEISVGRSFLLVERPYENVMFRLHNDDIIVEPLPPHFVKSNLA